MGGALMDEMTRDEALFREYEMLLLERDQAEKEAGQIWTCYIRLFGVLHSNVFAEKLECIQRKKAIAYYQRAKNSGGIVDTAALETYLEDELSAYRAQLKEMLRANERCAKAQTSSAYEVQRSKTLYRRIVKLLHPDLQPETDRDEALSGLWNRVVQAYHKNDVKTLSELEVLVRRELRERGIESGAAQLSDIGEKLDALRQELREITSTEPYTLAPLVNDEEAAERKRKELEEELEAYRRYRGELDAVIRGMLGKGDIQFLCQMN